MVYTFLDDREITAIQEKWQRFGNGCSLSIIQTSIAHILMMCMGVIDRCNSIFTSCNDFSLVRISDKMKRYHSSLLSDSVSLIFLIPTLPDNQCFVDPHNHFLFVHRYPFQILPLQSFPYNFRIFTFNTSDMPVNSILNFVFKILRSTSLCIH